MARVRRKWTAEEDALLWQAVTNAQALSRPLLWRELAKSVPGRSNKDCRRRWWNTLADCTVKGPWSEEEDERLISAVRKYGTSWAQVASEDENLLHAVLTHGTNWATIASFHTPTRNTLALKNRYSTLRLRHDNRKNSKEDIVEHMPAPQLPSSDSTTTNPCGREEWNTEEGCPTWDKSEELSQSDDDDEEEDEEGTNMGCDNGGNTQPEPETDSKSTTTVPTSIQATNFNLSSWDQWIKHSDVSASLWDHSMMPPESIGNRNTDAGHQLPYQNPAGLDVLAQYPTPREVYPDDGQKLGQIDPNGLHMLLETNREGVDLSFPPEFRALSQPVSVSPPTSDLAGTKEGPHQLSSEKASGTSPNIGESTNKSRSPILNSVLVGLAALGPGVTIKIDTMS
ncbi:hypothetical protein DL764_007288 [Monosporascus ibericus]|uniref:Myb-like domain-containing protein n=1 Tax=Monosporascus ibericus TaxID=155417 RepID=A0A4Q4T4B4_9PEZI|nr:hypothetical protein DL764_007288 [Monosporascus ibericus]